MTDPRAFSLIHPQKKENICNRTKNYTAWDFFHYDFIYIYIYILYIHQITNISFFLINSKNNFLCSPISCNHFRRDGTIRNDQGNEQETPPCVQLVRAARVYMFLSKSGSMSLSHDGFSNCDRNVRTTVVSSEFVLETDFLSRVRFFFAGLFFQPGEVFFLPDQVCLQPTLAAPTCVAKLCARRLAVCACGVRWPLAGHYGRGCVPHGRTHDFKLGISHIHIRTPLGLSQHGLSQTHSVIWPRGHELGGHGQHGRKPDQVSESRPLVVESCLTDHTVK